jgi:hypothetical protein
MILCRQFYCLAGRAELLLATLTGMDIIQTGLIQVHFWSQVHVDYSMLRGESGVQNFNKPNLC